MQVEPYEIGGTALVITAKVEDIVRNYIWKAIRDPVTFTIGNHTIACLEKQRVDYYIEQMKPYTEFVNNILMTYEYKIVKDVVTEKQWGIVVDGMVCWTMPTLEHIASLLLLDIDDLTRSTNTIIKLQR